MRIAIAGVVKSGKVNLANQIGEDKGYPVWKTDDTMGLGWSEASLHIADKWFSKPGPWIVEGVAVPRALRKWMKAHEGRPVDVCYWVFESFGPLSKGQQTMCKGIVKVWNEIEMELHSRGVEIVDVPKSVIVGLG